MTYSRWEEPCENFQSGFSEKKGCYRAQQLHLRCCLKRPSQGKLRNWTRSYSNTLIEVYRVSSTQVQSQSRLQVNEWFGTPTYTQHFQPPSWFTQESAQSTRIPHYSTLSPSYYQHRSTPQYMSQAWTTCPAIASSVSSPALQAPNRSVSLVGHIDRRIPWFPH